MAQLHLAHGDAREVSAREARKPRPRRDDGRAFRAEATASGQGDLGAGKKGTVGLPPIEDGDRTPAPRS